MTLRLSDGDLERIARAPGWRAGRIEIMETEGAGTVVIKGQRPARRALRYRLLDWLARAAGVPMLQAVPAHGGVRAQAIELRRLRALRGIGAPVPEVLHVGADHFVMTALGSDQLASLMHRGAPGALAVWREGGFALAEVHRSGQYLSQCFGRNMMVDARAEPPRFAGMIDFEDDPLEVMQLCEAQVRDWLIYLQSTLWMAGGTATSVDAMIDEWMDRETDAVRALFTDACRRLGRFRHLPRRRRFGRDVIAAQALAAAAHRHAARHRDAAAARPAQATRKRNLHEPDR